MKHTLSTATTKIVRGGVLLFIWSLRGGWLSHTWKTLLPEHFGSILETCDIFRNSESTNHFKKLDRMNTGKLSCAAEMSASAVLFGNPQGH